MHPNNVNPNHHWVVHIFDQIIDYGPVVNWWTFLFERLKKVLKSYSMNNHDNGEIEISFILAFNHDVALHEMVGLYAIMFCHILISLQLLSIQLSPCANLDTDKAEMFYSTIQTILATDGDVHGTVAALAQEINDHESNGKLFSPSNLLSNESIYLLATV